MFTATAVDLSKLYIQKEKLVDLCKIPTAVCLCESIWSNVSKHPRNINVSLVALTLIMQIL
jgi:hypothetical protein